MAKICFIHGLNSSNLSFNFITREMNLPDCTINYKSHQSLAVSIDQVMRQLPKDEPLILVGHSLGGVIAMNIVKLGVRDIQKVITISSPLGGSRAAVFARWVVSGLPVLSDIVPSSFFICGLRQPTDCSVLSIYTTSGSLPTSNEPNDSVVTVSSQTALSYAKKVEIKSTHFEVLLNYKTVKLINDFTSP